jgi:hypothetical protein
MRWNGTWIEFRYHSRMRMICQKIRIFLPSTRNFAISLCTRFIFDHRIRHVLVDQQLVIADLPQ